ncbi:TonB-dependent siderophore receptor [Halarcobacter anaerophilus]|uniref:TonB-dependent siderophore receptor n=1 Tax=Halarcobacter anaerophilus TaxID=877500 RepID=A0A4Q0Y0Z6_9BACT|nr:TonB-dependent siderophore receptor [Halarcobacter anaerophilus]QDF28544.1 TonB-dependent siderophore receptor [Halarcobacter anaerophilus]RXJ63273.1 TonB-dependent siderophore receptor [Halarcobacter anaerophilus]
MSSLKIKFLSPIAAMTLCINLYANEISYTIKSQSLKEAIEVISKKSKIPYIVNGKLLENKTSKAVKDIKGTKNALNQILENSGLEAEIEDGAIIIKEKKPENKSKNDLGKVDILANENDGSVETGYLVKELKQVGPWGAKSLQDTPYSMSVMSSDFISNILSSEIDQLYKMNPLIDTGVTMNYYGAPTVNIRGFTSRNVAFDGMSLSADLAGSLEEVERVEIMNGLTGFMYGSGNVGGLVNYVLKRPTYKRLTNLTVGNYGGDSYFAHLDVGNKIDEEGKFAFRINASFQDGKTIYENQNIEKGLISGALDWNISDNLILQLDASHRHYRVNRPRLAFQGMARLFKVPNADSFDTDKIYGPSWSYSETDTDKYGVNFTYNINENFTLRSRYLHKVDDLQYSGAYPTLSNDGTYGYYIYATAPREIISDAGYIYLDSKFDTGYIKHKLTLGVSGDFNKNKWYTNDTVTSWPSGLTYDESMSYPEVEAPSNGHKYTKEKSRNINIILGDDIVFDEQWSALIGINYTTIKSKTYLDTSASIDGPEVDNSYDKSEVTPTLSLIYKPFNNLTTYFSYMEGLEEGTIVGNYYSNVGEVLEPMISKQYEIGAKYTLNENLLLSTALFRIEKPNEFSDGASPQPKYVQDGEEVHQGLELTLTGKVTDNLTLMIGGTIMDLSVEDASSKELEGKKPTRQASKMASIYAEYSIPGLKDLILTGGAYYVGKKYANTDNSLYIPSTTTFDAGLRYKTKIDKYKTTFNLNVTNLMDKKYWASPENLGAPRTIMYSMKMEF